jgi:hypothetical protein
MASPEQMTFFASLDFPGRTTLMLWEIADRLGCSVAHLLNEIDGGALVGVDISGANVSRRSIRVPMECYRNYILKRLTGPTDFKMQFLRELPATVRRQLLDELRQSLKA